MVERIVQKREQFNLSEAQAQQLDERHVTVRDEKHRYSRRGGKPHQTTHQQMMTREQAFADAMAILSSQQRLQAVEVFDAGEKE